MLFTVTGGKFKFQVQDSFLEYFFWRFEKQIALSERKSPLAIVRAPQPQFSCENDFSIKNWMGAMAPLNPKFHRPYYLILARPRLWKDFILRQGHNPRLNQIQLR